MKSLEEMTKDELEQFQVAKEAEYQMSMDSLTTVELREAEISREITKLQLEKKQLAPALIQGKHNLRRIASELRSVKTLIYRRLQGL